MADDALYRHFKPKGREISPCPTLVLAVLPPYISQLGTLYFAYKPKFILILVQLLSKTIIASRLIKPYLDEFFTINPFLKIPAKEKLTKHTFLYLKFMTIEQVIGIIELKFLAKIKSQNQKSAQLPSDAETHAS